MWRSVRRRSSVFVVVVATAATTMAMALPAPQGAAAPATTAFKALSGSAATNYTVPADMRLVRRLEFGGRTYERYQQVYGPADAFVLGGQISVYRDASGAVRTVIGSHYPAIAPRNSVRLPRAAAFRKAARDVGASGRRTARVMIDPESGRYFYESRRSASRSAGSTGSTQRTARCSPGSTPPKKTTARA